MNETIKSILLTNLFHFENNHYTKNEKFIEAKRRKAIAILDEDAEELKEVDAELSEEYEETISYLDSISDEDYQSLKEELLQQVEEN
ncbi:TPA: transcriptional regulator [Streptococcus pyogenes]|uniref:transcriptional regulator n=1 Tax=Streptococcus TaxID=1301 RepID=UPI001FF257F2|nr:transcriptional regulator [Streptococcus uberis]HEP4573349.1 transcriptional regulator [Streptococcus pyogenes]MCK1219345.1 transcriptional regulator [Streptococcus uberis]MCK1248674.1 transcriptional regulator [Streptococcus uberis]HEP4643539.1 transcriptional regulator [Streptococcus pyogenes]HEP4646820.1 transcriptional regulator [Streptococcus pyogenes]